MYLILDGNRRINMNTILEYRSYNKSTMNGDYFQIELTHIGGTKSYLHFFKDENKRDEILHFLDKNLLLDIP